MRVRRGLAAVIVALLLEAGLAGRGSQQNGGLTGRIELLGRDGRRSPAKDAVISVPDVPGIRSASTIPAVVASKQKRFEPHVLVVTKGATVSFPNLDPIFHNVFSPTSGSAFDLGLYRSGTSKGVRFDTPGLVRLYCNIHPRMAAFVVVVEGGAFAVTGPDGLFQIDGLPAGRRGIRVWHERAGETEVPVQLVEEARTVLNLALDTSSFRELAHKNKHGEDYPPATNDVDRY